MEVKATIDRNVHYEPVDMDARVTEVSSAVNATRVPSPMQQLQKDMKTFYKSETWHKPYLMFIIPQSICALVLGCVEAAFRFSCKNEQNHPCKYICTWLFVASLINIVLPCVTLCGFRSFDQHECGGQFLQVAQLIVAGLALSYSNDMDCIKWFNDNCSMHTPNIVFFFQLYTYLFWIMIAMLIGALVAFVALVMMYWLKK